MPKRRDGHGVRVLVLAAVVALAAPHGAEAGNDEAGYLTPLELLEVVTDSDVTYKIASLASLEGVAVDDLPSLIWPRTTGEGLENPWVTIDENGGRTLLEFPLGDRCVALLREGEPLFDAAKYDEALEIYARAIEADPRCYVAYSHVGDCHFFRGEVAEALAWYDKAAGIDPYDFKISFYRGNALLKLGRVEEARDAFVRALALRPHRDSVAKVLRARESALGIRYLDRPFTPRALARTEGDDVHVYADMAIPAWLTWSLCKAVWIAEPEHRKARVGGEDHSWTNTEEKQCLLSMLDAYLNGLENRPEARDPQLDRILAVARSGDLGGFVFYEIGYRVHPDVTLLLPDETFDSVVDYVDHHVVVRVRAGDGALKEH